MTVGKPKKLRTGLAVSGSPIGISEDLDPLPSVRSGKFRVIKLIEPRGVVSQLGRAVQWSLWSAPPPSASSVTKCYISATDRALYVIRFDPADQIKPSRELKLWVSDAALHHDRDWTYKKAIFRVINKWMESDQTNGEIAYFG